MPLAIANEFIARAGANGITHMKLQKLVYMTLGSWLRSHDDSFLIENPQVWQYGPVFQSLYHELKHFRSAPIKQMQDLFGDNDPPRVNDPDLIAIIDAVWAKYANASAVRLSDITHLPGSPWHQIASKHGFAVPEGTEIKPELIGKYFRDTPAMAA